MVKEIDKFLRKYKVNEKTKIDLPLLIELLEKWPEEYEQMKTEDYVLKGNVKPSKVEFNA